MDCNCSSSDCPRLSRTSFQASRTPSDILIRPFDPLPMAKHALLKRQTIFTFIRNGYAHKPDTKRFIKLGVHISCVHGFVICRGQNAHQLIAIISTCFQSDGTLFFRVPAKGDSESRPTPTVTVTVTRGRVGSVMVFRDQWLIPVWNLNRDVEMQVTVQIPPGPSPAA